MLTALLDICSHVDLRVLEARDDSFKEGLEAARAIIKDQNGNELDSLVLLPLMLSYADPSLPIILFSSTQQRHVIHKLAHRPNIIADFAKPIPSGYSDQIAPTEPLEGLAAAVRKGVLLHEMRVVWQKIVRLAATQPIRPQCYEVSVKRDQTEQYNLDPTKVAIPNPVPFPLDPQRVRNVLAGWYVDYLLGEHFRDSLSLPYEFLESTLNHKGQRDFDMPSPDGPVGPPKRNYLAHALVVCRHRKSHGRAGGWDRTVGTADYRASALILFSILLDLLEPSPLPPAATAAISSYAAVLSRLKAANPRYASLRAGPPPWFDLIGDSGVPWVNFAKLTFAYLLHVAGNELAPDTQLAVERWAR
jgi:hypothetical protein